MMRNPDGLVSVLIEAIRADEDGAATQLRERTSEDIIEQYAEAMGGGDKFPAVDLVPAGDGAFFVGDGWHRIGAHRLLGRRTIDAVLLPVGEGEDPRIVALRHALKANTRHGLALTRGDQRKRAEAALLMQEFEGWKLRQIADEIGVSKSILSRVYQELLRARSIPERHRGLFLADYMPDWATSRHKLADDPFAGDEGLREEAMRYVTQLRAQSDLAAWTWRHEEREVEHAGLIDGATVRFCIDGNPVVDGLPSQYEVVPQRAPWVAQRPTREALNRLAARDAQRDLKAARLRLMAHPDVQLREAVAVLYRFADRPDLWSDIRTFVTSAGPAKEHLHEEF